MATVSSAVAWFLVSGEVTAAWNGSPAFLVAVIAFWYALRFAALGCER